MQKKLNFWIITELTDVNGSFVLRRLACEPPLATSSWRLQVCGLRTFYCAGYARKRLFSSPNVLVGFSFFSLVHSGVSKNNIKLNPWFVSGFIDGEGSFGIYFTKNSKSRAGYSIQPNFQITLHKKDYPLLKDIKNFFGIGSIYKEGNTLVLYSVRSFQDLGIIIKHFKKYQLQTQKRVNFELFEQIFDLMLKKEHLTLEGLEGIVAHKASMNLGLSEKLQSAFPDVVPVPIPIVKNKKIQDPNWLAGFTTGEGCFFIRIQASKTHSLKMQVILKFQLTQHSRDEQLMESLIKYLDCGNIYKIRNAFDFQVTKFDDITQKIIPFFKKHHILGVKAWDFSDFFKVAEMMKNKEHLTPEGLEKIKKIKAGMNTGRK